MCVPFILIGVAPHAPTVTPLHVGRTYVLGRSSKCDIVARHRSVSRKHAQILIGGLFLKVADLDSRQGTFVDDRRVVLEYLNLGQRLRLGKVEFILAAADRPLELSQDPDSFLDTDEDDSGDGDIACSLGPTREKVLQLLLTGLSEKQIARRLRIKKCTVHNHVTHLYRAFDVQSRAELLAAYLKQANGNGHLDLPLPAPGRTL